MQHVLQLFCLEVAVHIIYIRWETAGKPLYAGRVIERCQRENRCTQEQRMGKSWRAVHHAALLIIKSSLETRITMTGNYRISGAKVRINEELYKMRN